MEWVISSGKKDNSTVKNKQSARNGNDEGGKDLDDEETFTNGWFSSVVLLALMTRC